MQLYLGNLAPETDEPLLYELMSHLAPVSSVRMPKHKIKGTHQGYGFAVFQSEADAHYVQAVLSATPVKLFGRAVKASPASHATNQSSSRLAPPVPRIFVGGLDPQISDEFSIRLPFEKFGKVLEVEIIHSQNGHAFVTMENLESAESAVAQLNNQHILNHCVRVEFERISQ